MLTNPPTVTSLPDDPHRVSTGRVNLHDQRLLNRLVLALNYAFDLTHLPALPMLLGHAEIESNNAALRVWIHEQVAEQAFDDPNALFTYLAQQLQHTLMAWRHSVCE